jgi:hypothetical protein
MKIKLSKVLLAIVVFQRSEQIFKARTISNRVIKLEKQEYCRLTCQFRWQVSGVKCQVPSVSSGKFKMIFFSFYSNFGLKLKDFEKTQIVVVGIKSIKHVI